MFGVRPRSVCLGLRRGPGAARCTVRTAQAVWIRHEGAGRGRSAEGAGREGGRDVRGVKSAHARSVPRRLDRGWMWRRPREHCDRVPDLPWATRHPPSRRRPPASDQPGADTSDVPGPHRVRQQTGWRVGAENVAQRTALPPCSPGGGSEEPAPPQEPGRRLLQEAARSARDENVDAGRAAPVPGRARE